VLIFTLFRLKEMIYANHPDGVSFISACKDYAYFINRCYPERGTLKLVGDRYRLTRDERTILYRGISSGERSSLRKAKLVKQIAGHRLSRIYSGNSTWRQLPGDPFRGLCIEAPALFYEVVREVRSISRFYNNTTSTKLRTVHAEDKQLLRS
jgi:hypothetical protein